MFNRQEQQALLSLTVALLVGADGGGGRLVAAGGFALYRVRSNRRRRSRT
jgi:hypothetical protein